MGAALAGRGIGAMGEVKIGKAHVQGDGGGRCGQQQSEGKCGEQAFHFAFLNLN